MPRIGRAAQVRVNGRPGRSGWERPPPGGGRCRPACREELAGLAGLGATPPGRCGSCSRRCSPEARIASCQALEQVAAPALAGRHPAWHEQRARRVAARPRLRPPRGINRPLASNRGTARCSRRCRRPPPAGPWPVRRSAPGPSCRGSRGSAGARPAAPALGSVAIRVVDAVRGADQLVGKL